MDISLVSKECSGVWKALAPEQRQYWDSISEKEKEEYNKQKAEYQGPWRIATHKVKKKVCNIMHLSNAVEHHFIFFG